MSNPMAQTPAQQRYGLPKNPATDTPADVDLSKPLTLERAIQIGLERQNSIAIAATQAQSASARLTQARSQYFPQVTPSLNYNANLQPGGVIIIGGQPFRTGASQEVRRDSIIAQQLLLDSGQREANVGNSRRSLFAAEYNLADTRQSVILSVTENYFTLARSKELVRVQTESVKRAETNLAVIKAQVEQGVAAKSDILQAEADLANAQVAYLQALNDLNVSQANLKNAMGIVSPAPLTLPDERAAVPNIEQDNTSLEDYVKAAYANRHDVKSQQERINAQGYAVRQAHINAGLTVNATISQGYQLDPVAGETRSFNVALSYPLFDGGNARAAVKEAKAALESQQRTLDQLQQTVRLNVEQAFLVRELSRRRIVAAQAAYRAGQLNYEAALERQKNGIINILEVINAQVQLVTAEVSLVQGIYDFYIADARLLRSIGLNDPKYAPRIPKIKPGLITLPNVGQSPFRAANPAPNTPMTTGSAASPRDGVEVGRKP
jgi:outer membrane protein TolC